MIALVHSCTSTGVMNANMDDNLSPPQIWFWTRARRERTVLSDKDSPRVGFGVG